MRKTIAWICLLATLAGGGTWAYRHWNVPSPPTIRTAEVTLGPIRLSIAATGTVNPPSTITVGCEVSGIISELAVDFNDRVRVDQVIARINPELFDAEVKQAAADVAAARASVQLAEVNHRETARQLERTRALRNQNAGSDNELALQQAAHDAAAAELELAKAQLQRAESIELLARTKLERAVITSPIDGIVLTREVDVGQTVVAALQTPTLYTLAPELTRMVVHAHVSEADIGGVREGQSVSFTVDAYPQRTFAGSIRQVRHAARDIDNVVTYDVVIDAPNEDLLLKPGMTASVEIEVLRREKVLNIDSAALRFRPPLTPEQREALVARVTWPDGPDATGDERRSQAAAAGAPHEPAESDLVPSVQRVLWRYDTLANAWHPVPVWTGIVDGRRTEIRAGAEPGESFVIEATVAESALGLTEAIRLTQPENRRL